MKGISARIAQVALFLATASLAFNASAAPTVKIDGVRQNFPWSNAVEINYSVTDCETGSANNYALRFVLTKGGETTDITAAVGAPLVTNTAAGKVVWDAPADFASTPTDVTLSVSVVDTPFDGDLSKLVGDYEARDGQTLFGTLAGGHKLTIVAGATVTLSNAVVSTGLACLGDATLVLAGDGTNVVNGADGNPGISVPDGSTLTIQGGGSALAATGNSAAPISGAVEVAAGLLDTTSGDTRTIVPSADVTAPDVVSLSVAAADGGPGGVVSVSGDATDGRVRTVSVSIRTGLANPVLALSLADAENAIRAFALSTDGDAFAGLPLAASSATAALSTNLASVLTLADGQATPLFVEATDAVGNTLRLAFAATYVASAPFGVGGAASASLAGGTAVTVSPDFALGSGDATSQRVGVEYGGTIHWAPFRDFTAAAPQAALDLSAFDGLLAAMGKPADGDIPDGIYELTVYVQDDLGHAPQKVGDTLRFVVDTALPTIAGISVNGVASDEVTVSDELAAIDVVATLAAPDLTKVTLAVNGRPCDIAAGQTNSPALSISFATDYSYGRNELTATVTDEAGNTSQKTFVLWYLPPTVDLSALTADYEARDGQTLTGTLAGSHQLTIAAGATVTLSNAVVASLADNAGFAGLTCLGDATLVLAGSDTNIVNGVENHPGIFVPTNHTLTIQGDGTLAATGGYNAAGIGGGYNSTCGNIAISGGTVVATGGATAAGIGSGFGSTCGNIVISGGTVEATGGLWAAGIGSGYNSTCRDVTILGGTVEATGGAAAAGIGSGYGSTCDGIAISGGTVEATGGATAAGIGSGFGSTCGGIAIGAGIVKVVATRGSNAESIGKGYQGSCGTVTVDPETVDQTDGDTRTILPKTVDLATLAGGYEAQNGQTLAGTLAGSHQLTIADGATVTLSNAVVASLADNAGFAGLTCLGDAILVLSGSDTNVVNGAKYNPGIFVPTNHTLTIQGDGALAATGGYLAAGIGSGNSYSTCGDISISGGTVVAKGSDYAAGIGSGFRYSTCGAISILGGTVVATGGESGAGIGSGYFASSCGDISISGGTVIANGGIDGAGIGSGSYYSTCDGIAIGAGIVKVVATRGSNAESIGKGYQGSCGTVTVDPETVDQTDGDTRTIWPKRTTDLSTLMGDYEVQAGWALTGTLAGNHQLTIAAGATVTLSNAVVASLADNAGFAGLTCLGDATLVLAGSDTNIVNGVKDHPGIFVPTNHTLTIQGDGALAVTGGKFAAGIGCGDITISGGTVIATGGYDGAGIGGGEADIEISAGVVKVIATSGGGYGAESIKGKYVTIADPSKVTQN